MQFGRVFQVGSGSTAFSFEPQQCPGKRAITAYKTKTQTKPYKLVGLQFRCGRNEWLDPIEHDSGGVWSVEHEFECPGKSDIEKLAFKKDSGSLSNFGAQCKNGDYFLYNTVYY